MPSEPEERLVEQLGVVFGLFVLLVVIATLARRIKVPYPILLVVGGLLIGLLPGLPTVEPDPELVLLIFLPPLRTWPPASIPWAMTASTPAAAWASATEPTWSRTLTPPAWATGT